MQTIKKFVVLTCATWGMHASIAHADQATNAIYAEKGQLVIHLGNVPDFEAHGRLFLGRAGQFHSGPPVSPLNQSGAVETSRMFASPDIGCSEGVMGTSQDLS